MSDERTPASGATPTPDPELDPDLIDEPDPTIDDTEEGADEPEPEPDADEPEPEPEPRRSRGGETIRSLRSRAQSAERANAEYERRLAALETRQQQPAMDPQAAAREEQAFRESLRNMLPDEAALAVADRSERKMQAQIFQARLEGFDQADKSRYEALKATNRAAARLETQVETLLAQNRATGDYKFGRMDVFDLIRGRELRTQGPAAAATQRRNGAARVAAQTTRPASGRGDVARGGGGRTQDEQDEAMMRQIPPMDF